MHRFIKVSFFALLSVFVVIFFSANAFYVQVNLLPPALAQLLGLDFTVRAPFFVFVIAAAILGIMLGGLALWVQTQRLRRKISRQRREIERLEKSRAQGENSPQKDNEKDALLTLLEPQPERR